ncbi:MAG: DUF2071 domain-containing protein, partial [Pseudomonadota bacterium]
LETKVHFLKVDVERNLRFYVRRQHGEEWRRGVVFIKEIVPKYAITFVANIPGQTQTLPSAVYAFLQVPGGESAAGRLVIIAIIIAMGALILSEVMARRVAKRVAGT